MSIWKDLLFLAGHIATPTALAVTAPEAAPAPEAERRERPRLVLRANRVSPSEYGW
jgi:hypothetical protein